MFIKTIRAFLFFLSLLLINSCIVRYFPKGDEKEEKLVVVGLITDQPGPDTIKLSTSNPVGEKEFARPLRGCIVKISDDLGQIHNLRETKIGAYITDSASFRGVPGRKYTLHIRTPADHGNLNYESFPMEMKPVPIIDSLYYEKKTFIEWPHPIDGCQIYFDVNNPENICDHFRWDYSETWEFHLPYKVSNKICWVMENSNKIIIKNTSVTSANGIFRYPIHAIRNPIDRLSIKYSILVNQYSLNEDEYLYWERLKNTVEQVGGLYDIIPAAIPNNLYCIEFPNEKVLGYFSVSARSSKRIFIKDYFRGFNTLYEFCPSDTIVGTGPIEGLGKTVWIIADNSDRNPPTRIITKKIECADCTARGTTIEPPYWKESK
jgi:hypothetical protein